MKLTDALYRAARFSADVRAVRRSIQTGSPSPIAKRLANKAIGRHIVRRMWFK